MTVSDQITELTGEWILDPSRSAVSLASKSMGGLARVKGGFGQVTGQGTISPAGDVTGTLTIAAASIDTKHTKRDKHLRSADFFDSDNYPEISFAVAGVRPSGQGVTVTGTLSIRGRSRPLTFEGTATIHGEGEVVLDAVVIINRADFGLTWNVLGMAAMKNTLTIHAVFGRIPAR
jgi:polyisoprenoid-binding protein YceI